MNPEKDPDDVWSCKRLARQLLVGIVTFEEYAYNVTIHIMAGQKGTDEDARLQSCIDSIATGYLAQYWDYLRVFLEPVDFKPCPKPFLVDKSDAAIETAQNRFRPRYIRLYEMVRNKMPRYCEQASTLSGALSTARIMSSKETIMPEITSQKRWSATELRKLPAHERDAILLDAAARAEADYRNDPELTAFEAFGKDDLYGDSASTQTR